MPDTPAAETPRDPLVQLVHERGEGRRNVHPVEIRGEQPNTARDVEADTARRDHALTLHVRGRHAPDREAIAPMNIGHGVGGLHDPGERSDVRDLTQGLIREDIREQRLRGEDDAGHPHRPVTLDPPAHRPLLHERNDWLWWCELGHSSLLDRRNARAKDRGSTGALAPPAEGPSALIGDPVVTRIGEVSMVPGRRETGSRRRSARPTQSEVISCSVGSSALDRDLWRPGAEVPKTGRTFDPSHRKTGHLAS
jgi:hypothetical protein